MTLTTLLTELTAAADLSPDAYATVGQLLAVARVVADGCRDCSLRIVEAQRDVANDAASNALDEVERLTTERDAARADVERLTKELAAAWDATGAGRCARGFDVPLAEVVAQQHAERAAARVERDALAAEVKATAHDIADFLYAESSRLASIGHTREDNDRNQRSSALANAADSLRAGTWKETT